METNFSTKVKSCILTRIHSCLPFVFDLGSTGFPLVKDLESLKQKFPQLHCTAWATGLSNFSASPCAHDYLGLPKLTGSMKLSFYIEAVLL